MEMVCRLCIHRRSCRNKSARQLNCSCQGISETLVSICFLVAVGRTHTIPFRFLTFSVFMVSFGFLCPRSSLLFSAFKWKDILYFNHNFAFYTDSNGLRIYFAFTISHSHSHSVCVRAHPIIIAAATVVVIIIIVRRKYSRMEKKEYEKTCFYFSFYFLFGRCVCAMRIRFRPSSLCSAFCCFIISFIVCFRNRYQLD